MFQIRLHMHTLQLQSVLYTCNLFIELTLVARGRLTADKEPTFLKPQLSSQALWD